MFALGSAIGLYLVFVTGTVLLIIGAVGVVIGILYTGLKSHALGDLAVFLNFGLLGSLGAWVVQTKSFSWVPLLWTVPMALLVSAILHANNWRDSTSDREKKVTTVAAALGDQRSLYYYGFLIFAPFAIDFTLILARIFFAQSRIGMPASFLLVGLALPRALILWGRARRRRAPHRPMDFLILDGATANYNLVFGVLSTVAVWVHYIVGRL
jgi:1,4-dihydroxy-2-naphthoate octaprenyltransferase